MKGAGWLLLVLLVCQLQAGDALSTQWAEKHCKHKWNKFHRYSGDRRVVADATVQRIFLKICHMHVMTRSRLYKTAWARLGDALGRKHTSAARAMRALVANRKRWTAVRTFWSRARYREHVMFAASLQARGATLPRVLEQYAKDHANNAVNNRAIPPSKNAFLHYTRSLAWGSLKTRIKKVRDFWREKQVGGKFPTPSVEAGEAAFYLPNKYDTSTQRKAVVSLCKGHKLVAPAEGVLTSLFGPREDHFHKGLDITPVKGYNSIVRAAASGKVVAVYSSCKDTSKPTCGNGMGNYVIVQHYARHKCHIVYSSYSHLSTVSVRRGQYIRAGHNLGKCGHTGSVLGLNLKAHLHFELYYRGVDKRCKLRSSQRRRRARASFLAIQTTSTRRRRWSSRRRRWSSRRRRTAVARRRRTRRAVKNVYINPCLRGWLRCPTPLHSFGRSGTCALGPVSAAHVRRWKTQFAAFRKKLKQCKRAAAIVKWAKKKGYRTRVTECKPYPDLNLWASSFVWNTHTSRGLRILTWMCDPVKTESAAFRERYRRLLWALRQYGSLFGSRFIQSLAAFNYRSRRINYRSRRGPMYSAWEMYLLRHLPKCHNWRNFNIHGSEVSYFRGNRWIGRRRRRRRGKPTRAIIQPCISLLRYSRLAMAFSAYELNKAVRWALGPKKGQKWWRLPYCKNPSWTIDDIGGGKFMFFVDVKAKADKWAPLPSLEAEAQAVVTSPKKRRPLCRACHELVTLSSRMLFEYKVPPKHVVKALMPICQQFSSQFAKHGNHSRSLNCQKLHTLVIEQLQLHGSPSASSTAPPPAPAREAAFSPPVTLLEDARSVFSHLTSWWEGQHQDAADDDDDKPPASAHTRAATGMCSALGLVCPAADV